METTDKATSYGLLVINNMYAKGELTFEEWLEKMVAWAVAITEQAQQKDAA